VKRQAPEPETPVEPETSQDEPTRERPVDGDGRMLDRWGLPIGGPARVAALGDRTDPLVDPAGWDDAGAATPDSATPDAPQKD